MSDFKEGHEVTLQLLVYDWMKENNISDEVQILCYDPPKARVICKKRNFYWGKNGTTEGYKWIPGFQRAETFNACDPDFFKKILEFINV